MYRASHGNNWRAPAPPSVGVCRRHGLVSPGEPPYLAVEEGGRLECDCIHFVHIDGVGKLKRAYHMGNVTHLEFELLTGGSPIHRLATKHLDALGRSLLRESEARCWMRPIIETYGELLGKGIYHGDHHLDNVVFDAEDRPKLIVFEMVQFFLPKGGTVNSGPNPKGVRYFNAPEAAMPFAWYDPEKATVYSLGQMLRVLFEYGHDSATRDLHQPPTPSPFHRADLSPDVNQLDRQRRGQIAGYILYLPGTFQHFAVHSDVKGMSDDTICRGGCVVTNIEETQEMLCVAHLAETSRVFGPPLQYHLFASLVGYQGHSSQHSTALILSCLFDSSPLDLSFSPSPNTSEPVTPSSPFAHPPYPSIHPPMACICRHLFSRPSPRFGHWCSRVPPPCDPPEAVDQFDMTWGFNDIGHFPHDQVEWLGAITAGAAAAVHKARNKATGEVVALRTVANRDLVEAGGDGSDWMPRLQREIRALEAAKGIDGVVDLKRVYHMGQVSHMEFELLPGGNMLERLATRHVDTLGRSVLTEAQMRAWMRPVADAYAKLLAKGIYHGDEHLNNIVFDANDRPKLIDFESTQFFAARLGGGLVNAGPQPRGVFYYKSPEATTPCALVDPEKSTVFSLGQMLRVLLEFGHDPATRDLHQPPPKPSPFYRTDLSADVRQLIESMTAADPRMRPSIAQVLRHQWFAPSGQWTLPSTQTPSHPHPDTTSTRAAPSQQHVPAARRTPSTPPPPSNAPMPAVYFAPPSLLPPSQAQYRHWPMPGHPLPPHHHHYHPHPQPQPQALIVRG
ncbi:unnamed protein product [Vitrella brassicaformis CCMP3155]|uniref:Protein kinase domain-containing protein n=2 Tax=Vitrella brassicaformis TaxID=1169539 RepID=A0A0G4GKG1_VITBC|nr:unnamed protein product [Vitrella brassicaformis CCMP3155]|eukprot:CEM30514.1 unnamed protein product [Vitrella brassicaformis CCMP3155]